MDKIFTHGGDKGKLIDIFYRQLMTGDVITSKTVLTELDGGTLSVVNVSDHNSRNELKKAIKEVLDFLREHGYRVLETTEKKKKYYKYLDADKDPFKTIRFKAEIDKRYNEMKKCVNYIPIQFTYWPFDRSKMQIIFHPHIALEYNNRKFAIGVSEKEGKEPMRRYVIALDRIQSEMKDAPKPHNELIPCIEGEYDYLRHIVGVTMEDNAELTTITLRAHDKKTFGRIKTKPIHLSQKVLSYPNWQEGKEYGDFELTVYPNIELVAQILSHGPTLEVLSPASFRMRIADSIKDMNSRYETDNTMVPETKNQ